MFGSGRTFHLRHLFVKKGVFCAAFLLALLMSGCGAESDSAVEPAGDAEKSYHFVFVCPFHDAEYWGACIEGIEETDKELGTHTEVLAPEEFAGYDVKLVENLEKAIAMQPDGIMAYSGVEAMYPLINEAVEQGIPFVCIDSDAPKTSRLAFVGTVPYTSGYKAGETMVNLVGKEAKIGIFISSKSAQKEMEVLEAFQDAIADYQIEVVAIEETDADPDVAEKMAEEMLKQYPEITAMFSTCGYNLAGTARVKEKLQRDNLVLVGFDDIEENLDYIRKDVIDALVAQLPEQMGVKGVRVLKEYIDTGRLKSEVYETDIAIVTKDNVETYKD